MNKRRIFLLKNFISISFILSLILSFIPAQAFAAVNDTELQPYLDELGWTKEELDSYMQVTYEFSINEFDTFEELSDFLGEVTTEEMLNELLAENEFTMEELKSLLVSNKDMEEGQEIIEAFPFYDDLVGLVEYYAEMTPITEGNLQDLLNEHELTEEELNKLLADNDESLEDYKFIEDLQWSVELYLENLSKTPITADSLAELLARYNLTNEEFEALLVENDDSLDNYNYIEDLDMTLDFYINYQDMVLPDISDLGITEEEIERLIAYFDAFNEEDPAFMEKIAALEEKYAFLEEWDFASEEEMTEEQIAQIYELYQDILDLFNIELKFSLSKNGQVQAVSMEQLMAMETSNGADLIIEIYTASGELLADMVLPEDLLAEYELDGKPVDAIVEEVQDEVIQVASVIQKKTDVSNNAKTVIGGKLPNTASNLGLNMIIGLFMVMVGAWLFRKFIVKGA